MKAYLTQWLPRKKPGEEHISDFLFDPDRAKAAYWPTRETAAFDCDALNAMNIEFTSPEGARYLCTHFQVEERPSVGFVVFCIPSEIPLKRQPQRFNRVAAITRLPM
jgi:hypothetical protein